MSTNPGKSGSQLPFDPLSAFEQAPAFALTEEYNPLFPMGDTLPLEGPGHLDPEETFDVLFGAQPIAETETTEDEPDLATMKVAKPPTLIPYLPLPPA
jgi:hypothetical protein